MKPDKDFNPSIAEEIIRRVREGDTFGKIARDSDMPSRLTIYDWLKNPANKFGAGKHRKSFNQHYKAAQIDREMTWQDLAIEEYDLIELKHDRTDNATLKLAADKANMRLRVAKEFKAGQPKGAAAESPTVIIRKFGTKPSKVD